MKRKSAFTKGLAALLLVVLAATIAVTALAQPGSGVSATPDAVYDLSWHVMGAGGGNMSGNGASTSASAEFTLTQEGLSAWLSAGFTLHGTAGQTATGSSAGSGFELGHGFWYGLLARLAIYLPVVRR